MTDKKLKLRGVFFLKCPYCLKAPLRKDGSWFEFSHGCQSCDYQYEREPGYFFASPWMVNYPLSALVCFGLSFILFRNYPEMYVLLKAAFVAGACIIAALFLYPFSRAIWLFMDHLFKPLSDEDLKY